MKKKVMVFDDDPIMVMLMRTKLEAAGYEVTVAEDKDDAIGIVVSEKPDVIILDVLIVRPDVYHFVKEIRKRKDAVKLIPIVLLSDRKNVKDLFESSDIHGFIMKPFHPAELVEKINQLFFRAQETAGVVGRAGGIVGSVNRASIIGHEWGAMQPIKAVLESRGAVVYVSRDSYRAVEDVIKNGPDVIFVSSVIIGMDVWTLTNLFRELPSTKTIPIVVFDAGNVGLEGSRTLRVFKVITYTSHEELTQQVERCLKELFI